MNDGGTSPEVTTGLHAAIVVDDRAVRTDGTFRAVVFRFGGDSECFDLTVESFGRLWRQGGGE